MHFLSAEEHKLGQGKGSCTSQRPSRPYPSCMGEQEKERHLTLCSGRCSGRPLRRSDDVDEVRLHISGKGPKMFGLSKETAA